MTMAEEVEMIDRILHGDSQAFSAFVDKYQNLIFHVVRRIVPAQMDAEDVCQEVFVKVYRGIGSFRHQSKLSTWVARIAYLTALNHSKKDKRSRTEDFPEDTKGMVAIEDNPEEQLSKKSTAEYLNELILQLPEHYRIVLTLFHLEEFSIEEISASTSMPVGTVKNYLFRARRLLKNKIKDQIKER